MMFKQRCGVSFNQSRSREPWDVGEGLFPFPPSCFPIGQRSSSFVISCIQRWAFPSSVAVQGAS